MLCLAIDYGNIVVKQEEALDEAEKVQAGPIEVDLRHFVEAAASTAVLMVLFYLVFAALLLYFREELLDGKREGPPAEEMENFEMEIPRGSISMRVKSSSVSAESGDSQSISSRSPRSSINSHSDSSATIRAIQENVVALV